MCAPKELLRSIREIANRCLASEPLDDAQSRLVGAAFQEYIDHRFKTMDEALGLTFPRGGVPWWLEEAIETRNSALQELADRHFSDRTRAVQARAIHRLATRYQTTAWLRDKERSAMEPGYEDTPKEWLWRAFQSGAAMPISERQLRSILKA